ncbi:hypothetical protein M1N61_02865 [Peptococcaceae bacterium]|nr:hypothetical protein [Peptococcaceae bacterium]
MSPNVLGICEVCRANLGVAEGEATYPLVSRPEGRACDSRRRVPPEARINI